MCFFFFQAEDGIRDYKVTGVQTWLFRSRDRRFDKALARHLRSAAPAGEAARLPAAPTSQGGSCPDSETLAAYHERSLLPEELNSWKEHFVGCANCQNILAQLEATDEISFEAAEREEVVEKGSEPVIAARRD